MSQKEKKSIRQRAVGAGMSAIKPGLKTAWWMIRLTVMVSFAVTVLQYLGVIAWLSVWLNPIFNLIGLPGEAALVFISGYFVNLYSAIAAVVTLDISLRGITILAVMGLCAHNMIIETAVQKKTGSSGVRMVILRTGSAILLAFVLNWLMPKDALEHVATQSTAAAVQLGIWLTVQNWFFTTLGLMLKMFLLIMSLNILQKLLAEFGVIRWLSKLLRPLLKLFGLPAKTSFLWIVANVLGLAYGAAIMIEESEQGKVSPKEVDLLNHHVAISHSNLEDVSLFLSVGASLAWMILSRLALAIVVVWLRRLELWYFDRRKAGMQPV